MKIKEILIIKEQESCPNSTIGYPERDENGIPTGKILTGHVFINTDFTSIIQVNYNDKTIKIYVIKSHESIQNRTPVINELIINNYRQLEDIVLVEMTTIGNYANIDHIVHDYKRKYGMQYE